MPEWYLVKKNYPIIADTVKLYNKQYIGLGGDAWSSCDSFFSPEADLVRKIDDTRVYFDNIRRCSLYVSDNLILNEELVRLLIANKHDAMLIKLQIPDGCDFQKIHGFDFGNPEGGYSIIETEIISRNSAPVIERYLNQYGLFDNLDLLNDFLSTLNKDEVEELDNYYPVAITKLL